MPKITEKLRLYGIEYRKKNKEMLQNKSKGWYMGVRRERFLKNPQRYLWLVARTRAKQKGVEFSISQEDIIIPAMCPIRNVPLVKAMGFNRDSMSVDRVNNDKGYVKGNVRVISRHANIMKSALTLEMLERILMYIKGEI